MTVILIYAIIILVKGEVIVQYPLYLLDILVKSKKTFRNMQAYVKENRLSEKSFIEYVSLLKMLAYNKLLDNEQLISYANSLLNASVIVKREDVYNKVYNELNELFLTLKENNLKK